MLQQLISHNTDIKKLVDKHYKLEVSGGQYLIVHQIPYVTSDKVVENGDLICVLTLATPTKLGKPRDHTIFFRGETPCDYLGKPLTSIINNSTTRQLTNDIIANHYFSSKPISGMYIDYFDKINTYATILSSNANELMNKLKVERNEF